LWCFFGDVSSMWTKMVVYFYKDFEEINILLTFIKSSETKTGSAGEQLVRDSLDDRQKWQSMGDLSTAH
jgi:hypothetical protein